MGNSPSLGQGGTESYVSRDIEERDERPQSNQYTELAGAQKTESDDEEKSHFNPLQLYSCRIW